MNHLSQLPLPGLGENRALALPASSRFSALRLFLVDGRTEHQLGDEEAVALLLSGTFDLAANGNHWGGRGARTTPLQGRPLALFLPPRASFEACGAGEILLLAARPAADAPDPDAATGRAALSQQPLLPLAGSGKAFDPQRGEWRMAETFPSSPEILPPRRIDRSTVDGVAVERVFPLAYKASTLSLDELVLAPGQGFDAAALPGRPPATELLLFVRSAARVTIRAGAEEFTVIGDAVLLQTHEPGAPRLWLRAGDAKCYAVLAHAGK